MSGGAVVLRARGAARVALLAALGALGALGLAGAGGARALADEADGWFERGRAALERGAPDEAGEAFARARELAPARADVCYHLARARELDGRAEDAIAFYHETARLDRDGPLGRTAQADESRLRAQWVRVELEQGQEMLDRGRFVEARAAYASAFDVATDPAMRLERTRAREGYARAGARELAREALKGRAPNDGEPTVHVLPMAWVGRRDALAEMAEVLEAEVARALRERGARVHLVRSGGAPGAPSGPDASRPALVVRGKAGQRFVLVAEDARGAALAEVALRALADGLGPSGLPPEVIELDVAIDAERDDQAPPRRIALAEGVVLRSGDRFRIRARASRDCYFYAVIVDSQGIATQLYPGAEKLFPDLERAGVRTPNPVRGAVDIVVPPHPPRGEPYWFVLDDHTGVESFYVAASLVPLDDIEGLAHALQAAGDASVAASARLADAFAARAAATDIERTAAGEVLRGRGAVVRYLAFEHR